ncbi:hypothetical protein JNUCC0626_48585 [Lentzea sp. JNUCC 0626]|uniref:hypothetical protein n=1 Tax=Lentzea sp. JNUCC 0626 TaxID=3367513 RepID=UPI003748E0A9
MFKLYWDVARRAVRARIALLRRIPDAGYVSEWVLLTALLVSAVLVVVGIFVAKIIAKVNGIEL